MSLLEQNTIKKKKVNKLLDIESELDEGENKKYRVEVIKVSVIYAIAAISGQLLGLYYLVSLKNYSEDKSI